MNGEEVTLLEAFHYAYDVFIQSVATLAMEPSDAVETYGHYNVAAELQLECAGGKYLFNSPVCPFTEHQRAAITLFVGQLEGLPSEATLFTDIKPESLVRMQHPAWIPIRAEARKLLEELKPITMATSQYFSGGQSAA